MRDMIDTEKPRSGPAIVLPADVWSVQTYRELGHALMEKERITQLASSLTAEYNLLHQKMDAIKLRFNGGAVEQSVYENLLMQQDQLMEEEPLLRQSMRACEERNSKLMRQYAPLLDAMQAQNDARTFLIRNVRNSAPVDIPKITTIATIKSAIKGGRSDAPMPCIEVPVTLFDDELITIRPYLAIRALEVLWSKVSRETTGIARIVRETTFGTAEGRMLLALLANNDVRTISLTEEVTAPLKSIRHSLEEVVRMMDTLLADDWRTVERSLRNGEAVAPRAQVRTVLGMQPLEDMTKVLSIMNKRASNYLTAELRQWYE
jgi:hypothetical protein